MFGEITATRDKTLALLFTVKFINTAALGELTLAVESAKRGNKIYIKINKAIPFQIAAERHQTESQEATGRIIFSRAFPNSWS